MSENPSVSLTLAAHIRRSVIESIAQGDLAPGSTIDEQALCKRFDASRTPVREAMLQLAAEGFVSNHSRSGITVTKLSIAKLRELLELLAELEAAAAKFATRRMSPAELGELRHAFDRCNSAAQTGDAEEYRDANDRFHDVIYEGSCNEALVNQIRVIRTRCASYTQDRFESPGRILKSLEEHRQLLVAIESGDPARGHAQMLEHISIGGRDFSEFVSRLPAAYISE